MNKNTLTNSIALLIVIMGFVLEHALLKTVGLFALSGAITNSLAIHMLFEKVPGLYGSGVIPNRFEDFKVGIKTLIMEQFFTSENVQRFMAQNTQQANIDIKPVLAKLDLSPTFDSLVATIQESSFGQMLGMFGGVQALDPLRQPFIEKMGNALEDLTQQPEFSAVLNEQLQQFGEQADVQNKVGDLVDKRLNELTPKMVKEIVQQMIKQHLGWLVVWGGVFGGLIGLVTALVV